MSDDKADTRAEWKIRLVAFLLLHLKGNEAERDSVVNAVLMALDTAHAEGIRHAADFCRTVGTGAQQHVKAATEPPRVSRRLQLLRDWSHDEAYPTVFP